jgi:hypothetical protein
MPIHANPALQDPAQRESGTDEPAVEQLESSNTVLQKKRANKERKKGGVFERKKRLRKKKNVEQKE